MRPSRMLDTGGHMAVINDIAFTPDGRQSSSRRATTRPSASGMWRAGKTVRTIRGEVAREMQGKIYAMALSPDGRWLAVGGMLNWDAQRTRSAHPPLRLR